MLGCPDGGLEDSKTLAALVTQIVQAGGVTARLYYAALPKSGLNPAFLASLKS